MKNSNIPEVRFPEFKDAWEMRKLSELATLNARIGWQNLRTSEFLDSGDYMLITGTDFKDGGIDYSNVHYVEKERYDQDKKIQIQNDSILITKDGTLGKVAYVEGLEIPATLNAGVFNVRVQEDDEVDSQYLFHYLKAPFLLNYADAQSTGGTIKHLNKSVLVNFPIPFPIKEEQKKIGLFFRQLDDTIALHQRKLNILKQTKQGFLQKMFPKEGEKVPEVRFPGFTDNWESLKFSDVFNKSSKKNSNNEFGKDKVISVAQMKWSSRESVSSDLYMQTYNILGEGSIAFEGNKSKSHMFGRFVFNNIGTGIVSHIFNVFDPINYFDFKFMKEYINNECVMRNILMRSTTKTLMMTTLNTKEILEQHILLPKIEEQIKIGNFFKQLDDIIGLHQRELEILKNTKKAFLQKMFV